MIEITDTEFRKMRDFIKSTFGISLSDEKKTLVQSRLRATIAEHNFSSFTQYFDFIRKEPTGDAMVQFIDKITTNHTFFMRETEHFDYFRDVVLPYIRDEYGHKQDLSMWCGACSSGEEPITLQIIAQEFFKKTGTDWNTQMLATDISTKVLDKAVAGVYQTSALAKMPRIWQHEYFTKVDSETSRVSDTIRKNILYRKLNFLDPFPFKRRFQVIFCRNVMIYFDKPTRDAIVKKFFDVTEPGGYLFIGHSESISNSGSKYQYIKPAIYRKPK